jgi:hypothetical protein
VEHSTVNDGTGRLLKVGRDTSQSYGGSNHMLAALSVDGGYTYGSQINTEIPDNPTRNHCLRLSNGNYIFALNANKGAVDREPLSVAFSTTPYAWSANNTYKLVGGYSGTPIYSGEAKGGGASYVDLVELPNGRILAAYSVAKEDIKTVVFTVPTIN